MIDEIYQTLLTLISKDNQGYVTPTEFDRVANIVQNQIFREYFENENRDKIKANKGLVASGYANLPFNERQRIDQFAETSNITYNTTTTRYDLPTDIYFIEDDGIMVDGTYRVVTEVERRDLNHILLPGSLGAPSEVYPVYERFSDSIKVYPSSIQGDLVCRYLREPKRPRWTYYTLPNNEVMFDPSNPDFQDFELHYSEYTNIILRMLPHFGLSIREEEVIQVAEAFKRELKQNDEG